MSTLRIEPRGHVTVFTLDRPEKRNAYDDEMMAAITAGILAFDADPEQYVAVVTGAGDAFCSGNDLSTPQPEFGFPGLEPGDRWCLCAARWQEALEAGNAPRVILSATHEATLEIVALDDLKRYAIDLA